MDQLKGFARNSIKCIFVVSKCSQGELCSTCCPVTCCTCTPYYYGAQSIAYPINSLQLQNQLQDNIKNYPYLPWNGCSRKYSNYWFPSWSEAVNAYHNYYPIHNNHRKVLRTKEQQQQFFLGSKSRLKLPVKAGGDKAHTVLIPIPTITALILRPVHPHKKTSSSTPTTFTTTSSPTTSSQTPPIQMQQTTIMEQAVVKQETEVFFMTSPVTSTTPAAVVIKIDQQSTESSSSTTANNPTLQLNSREIGMVLAKSAQAIFHYTPVDGTDVDLVLNTTAQIEQIQIDATTSLNIENMVAEEKINELGAENMPAVFTLPPEIHPQVTMMGHEHAGETTTGKVLEKEVAPLVIESMAVDVTSQQPQQPAESSTAVIVPSSTTYGMQKIETTIAVDQNYSTEEMVARVETNKISTIKGLEQTSEGIIPTTQSTDMLENTTFSTVDWGVDKLNNTGRKIFIRHATPSNTVLGQKERPEEEKQDDRSCALRNQAVAVWGTAFVEVFWWRFFLWQ